MKIAVVILNWNGQKLLEKFLPNIVKYSAEASVFVADNASTDHSVSYVLSHFPTVTIIQNEQNFGFAKGYNESLKELDYDIYALVNSDIEVTENWLSPIITTFQKEPTCAIIQPKILDYNNNDYFEYAGAGGGFIDKYGFAFCRGRVFESIEKDTNQYQSQSIFWATGACLFIRAQVFQELNGFDPDFFAHQEEIDLCWRARNNNYETKYVAESTVYHIGGATLEKSNPKKTYLNFRNSLLMLLKNLPSNEIFSIIFIRMLFDGVAGIRFLLQGNFSHFTAVLKAHFSFYKMISSTLKKRTKTHRSDYFYTKSIVKTHFLKKINRFCDIY